MACDQHTGAGVGSGPQEARQRAFDRRIESSRRFIEKQQIGPRGDHGDGQLLAFTRAQVTWVPVEPPGKRVAELRRQSAQFVPDRRRKKQGVRILGNVGSADLLPNASRLWAKQARDKFQQGRLSGAVAAHQCRHLATVQCQGDTLDRPSSIVPIGHVIEPADDFTRAIDRRDGGA